jgi:glycosyltransferase involved in cell wall biosynthesis
VIGLLRVKNEARWIERVIASIQPVCSSILVMDDHSDDGTPFLCSSIPGVTVYDSPFTGLNETRDKNWLLDRARGNDWVLMVDGDEVLDPASIPAVQSAMQGPHSCLSFRILYLWDREDQVRVDGVYGKFRRPSMFRPAHFHFEGTVSAGNFHCGNAPIALQIVAQPIAADLLHLGYLHREDRLRKYEWYRRIDGGNRNEDGYRHVAQGDLPEIPADMCLRHAGPMRFESRA